MALRPWGWFKGGKRRVVRVTEAVGVIVGDTVVDPAVPDSAKIARVPRRPAWDHKLFIGLNSSPGVMVNDCH